VCEGRKRNQRDVVVGRRCLRDAYAGRVVAVGVRSTGKLHEQNRAEFFFFTQTQVVANYFFNAR
jgi:hypothetical protein